MSKPLRHSPLCIVIAGPKGAGKTTFAHEFLPKEAGVIHFVNADLIAGGLSPLRPEIAAVAAGRLFSRELDRLALRRIAARVKQGGHAVPRADVLRRFDRSWANFQNTYQLLADAWAVYDNSGVKPRLLEQGP